MEKIRNHKIFYCRWKSVEKTGSGSAPCARRKAVQQPLERESGAVFRVLHQHQARVLEGFSWVSLGLGESL
ncbi:hypothetical protein TSUD_215320 [Trifolium subterraneum]|uniref:Uncharacterized protein n=1 Tax=Trifolium subterraneum TaxID=3900 RepID=A0A2Z6N6J7_TRISU|nr:hypothetical protein TSUD_215320 [Trifolium subterraneum]